MKNVTTEKQLFAFSLLVPIIIGTHSLLAQNVAINATGNQADPSAMLDVSSTTAGVLIPRMNTTQRNAITSPAVGLQIFNTDCNELNYWNGTCWISMGSLPIVGPITSNSSTALCASVTAAYSVPAVTGATGYLWSVPAGAVINSGQGTTSASVTFGNYSGQICVRAYNACEASELTCIDVNISPIPPTPGNITGSASIIPGQTNVTYFIGSVTGANIYTWSLPSGASIVTGIGTPLITVNFSCSAVSGNVSVTAGSNCGSSTASLLAVTVSPNLAASAGSAVFGGAAIGGSPTATGGATPYTYSWSPNTNLSGSAVANPTALCSGSTTNYTVTVTDALGCTATSSVVVTRNLTANAGSAVFGGSVIGGSPTATGGVSPYNYSWSPNNNLSGYTLANPTAQCGGSTTTYTVTVSDANGCTATSSVIVTRNLVANAGSGIFGGSNLNGTANGGVSPYSYSWSPNSNLSSYSVANPLALCSGSTNIYSLTVSDANGCTATNSAAVTRNLTANAGSNMNICTGGATPIGPATASGGNSSSYSYSWNPATNLSSSTSANPTANPASTNTYTLTVTDANGCTATSSMTLTVNTLPVSTFTNSSPMEANTSITFTPTTTGGVTYSWTFSGGSPGSSTTQNPSVTWSSTGTYNVSLTVTSSSTGCTSTTTNTITIVNPTIVSFTSSATWTVPAGLTSVQVLVVGGGGGGYSYSGNTYGGGGGGGGVQFNSAYSVSPGTINVTVGGGGSAGGGSGGSSAFGTFTAAGGSGGTGNGGASGNGYSGGNGSSCGNANVGGGGGGAGGPGTSGSCNSPSGSGGPGVLDYAITGSYYGGGGGGGSQNYSVGSYGGSGGSGGGGKGYGYSTGAAVSGTANTGGGGGASDSSSPAGSGGSGIVIIKY